MSPHTLINVDRRSMCLSDFYLTRLQEMPHLHKVQVSANRGYRRNILQEGVLVQQSEIQKAKWENLAKRGIVGISGPGLSRNKAGETEGFRNNE